jgi:MYND finger
VTGVSSALELAVMLRAPLPCFRDPLLWCANCHKHQAFMAAGEHVKWCSRCQCVRYCSRRCQAEHWRDGHRRVCKGLAALMGHGSDGGDGDGGGGGGTGGDGDAS